MKGSLGGKGIYKPYGVCVCDSLGTPKEFLSGSKRQLGRCLGNEDNAILAQEETSGLVEQERRPRQMHVDARKCRIKVEPHTSGGKTLCKLRCWDNEKSIKK